MIHATVGPVHGVGPVRHTKMYAREGVLLSAVRRLCYALRMPGPYLVQRYEDGRLVDAYTQD